MTIEQHNFSLWEWLQQHRLLGLINDSQMLAIFQQRFIPELEKEQDNA